MGVTEDTRELRSRAADHAAQERAGATAHTVGRVAPGYIRAIHPEHHEPVLYVPGELLPAWCADALDDGHGQYNAATGTFLLGAL